jgi:hypothetical protein
MHDLPIRKQGASCDLRVAKAQSLAFADGRELLCLGLRDLIEKAACVPWLAANAPTSLASMASSAELSTSFGSNAERVRALSNRSRPWATFYRYLAVAAAPEPLA